MSTRDAAGAKAGGTSHVGGWRLAAAVLLATAGAWSAQWPAAGPGHGVPGAAAQDPTAQPRHVVTIAAEGLSPSVIALPVGHSVVWVNESPEIHNTTHVPDVGQPVIWNSGDIPADGGAFEQVFDQVGTYNYIDLLVPDVLAFQGTVIVTDGSPTGTPLVPTKGPTPTEGPTATRLPPTATLPPSPTVPSPTRQPVVIVGRMLSASRPECAVDAAVRPCDDPTKLVYVRTDGALDPSLVGRDVRLEGVMVDCDSGGLTYLWMSQASELPGGCNRPTATPSPTATTTPPSPMGMNFALGRPVTAKGPALPAYEPDRATDGQQATFWFSDHQVSWAYVDLGEARTFNQIRLDWAAPYATRYGIYVWEEGAWRGRLVVDNARGGEDVRTLTFTTARYVMLYLMTSSAPSGGFALREWEVYGEERPNWALGQPVLASSDQAGQVGAYATDGLMGTFWVSAPGDTNPWLAVYLPASVQMTEFRLWWTSAFPRYYSLVFFEKGLRTLYSPVQLPNGGLHRLVGRVPVRADTVMIYTHESAPQGFIGLQEIEILGPGPGDDVAARPAPGYEVDAYLSFTRLGLERSVGAIPLRLADSAETIR